MGAVERELQVTEDDLLEAKEIAASFTLEDARRVSHDSYPCLCTGGTKLTTTTADDQGASTARPRPKLPRGGHRED